MAWRIHRSVKRGEIDNRQRGRVHGRLWLDGLAEPVVLDLEGNACSDLAGCLLTFENPGPTIPLRPDEGFHPVQRGTIGDLTASRKVRVPDVPLEEFLALRKAGQPAPEHWANCLYLEWFSEANGRVVVESTEYRLTVSPPAWTLTPEEEAQRQQAAADGFKDFLGKVSEALALAQEAPPRDEPWDEFDYERFLRECDARTEKYGELLDKYRNHPDREDIIAREMGWLPAEDASATEVEEDSPEGEGDDWLDAEEIKRLCEEALANPPQPDPLTEGVDWVRGEDGDIVHPLARQASEGCRRLWQQGQDLGLENTDDPDLADLFDAYHLTCAKLAGALNSLAYGRSRTEGPFIVAYLKRALGHLHTTQAALEKVAAKSLLPATLVETTRRELFALREEILRLMEEFRRPR